MEKTLHKKTMAMKKTNKRIVALVFIVLVIIQASCERRGGDTRTNRPNNPTDSISEEIVVGTEKDNASPRINLFVENSASMNGFINNASDFQNAITALTSLLKNNYGKDKINLGFINSKVVPQKGDDPYRVVNGMLVKTNFTSAGSTNSTDLNNLIKLVIDNTNDNTLTLFVSDCIYSIQGTGTTPSLLANCKNGTMDVILEKYNEIKDLSMLIVRMKSNFNGGYWDYKHPSGRASQQLNNQSRPYYLCVVGTNDNVVDFTRKVSVEELPGYAQQYFLCGKDLSQTFYTVVSKPYNSGAFVIMDNSSISIRRPGGLKFAIAVNLSDFPMSEEDKVNLDNYLVEGGFEIMNIVPIKSYSTDLEEKNKIIENKCTHYIVVSPQGNPSDFTIHVKRQVPSWVKEYSSDDDTGICNSNDDELKKTFGLSYFINGMAEAYREKSKEKDCYVTMNIKIKHN